MTDGSTCAVTLDLAPVDPTTLSYQGGTTCAGEDNGSPTYVYADRREATRILNGDMLCGGCPGINQGQITAAPGATYTATYYFRAFGPFSSVVPDDCWAGQSTGFGPYVECELSGSVVFPS